MVKIESIDYDHYRAGGACNGIISVQDGQPEAAWTYDLDGRCVTRTDAVEPGRLAGLWDIIDASLAHRGVFWRHRVVDPTRLADPYADHLITAEIVEHGQRRCLLFAIPSDEVDAEFTGWLDRLSVPTGPTSKRAAPGAGRPADQMAFAGTCMPTRDQPHG